MDVAATAPVLSAAPVARAHLPIARSVGEAVPVVEKVVVGVRVTTTLVVALVDGSVSLTVTVDPVTAVTDPDAAANEPLPKRPAPAGRDPEPGVPEPGVPEPGVNGRPPPPGAVPPPGRPPNPPEQDPATGWDTDTVVAVTGLSNGFVADVEASVGLPNAEMHVPTVTDDADVVVICRNVVADV